VIGRRWWVPWLWLSPALALLGVFLVYPVVDTVRRSFLDENSEAWVGLENYEFIIENPAPLLSDTHSALLNNVLWLTLFVAVTVALGLVLAVLTSRVRYEALAKSAIFIPMAISFVAAGIIWRFMFAFDADIGTVNAALTGLGADETAWLQNPGSPLSWAWDEAGDWPAPLQLNNFSLISVGVWMWTGFAMVILSAGLKGIPADLLEAARVDGASEWQIFWRIIVPLLRPTVVVVATTLLINALKVFDLIWVMTGGRFETDVVATLFFRQSFLLGEFGRGAALAVILMLFVVPLMLLTVRRFQAEEEAAR
jgi:alpha-glucoside transport system permease protein